MNASPATATATPAATPAATPPAQRTPRRNPIAALDKKDTISLIERDFAAVLAALGWDPGQADILVGGETIGFDGTNKVCTSAEIFAGCEEAWGKRPGADAKDLGWQAFDAAVARVMAQARRAHLIKGNDGIVRESPEQARKDGESTPRPRKSASPIRDGQLSGEAWPAHCAEALVAAIGNRLPGRDALAAALQSCGYVLVKDDASGIVTIELPKPRTLTAEQSAKMEKADTLDRKATGLEKDGVAEAAAICRKMASEIRAAVEAELSAAPANVATNGAAHVEKPAAAAAPAAPANVEPPAAAPSTPAKADAKADVKVDAKGGKKHDKK